MQSKNGHAITLGEFLFDRWLPAKERQLRFSTWISYRDIVRSRVVPRLGHLRLDEINGEKLNELYGELLARGRADGRGSLSVRSVRYTHTVLSMALKDACRWGLLAANPADAADPPRDSGVRVIDRAERIRTWSAGEVKGFLAHVSGHRLAPLFELAISTGMRRGELLGLRWENADLEAGRLSVTSSRVATRHAVSESAPKTRNGRRSIEVDQGTVSILRSWRVRQAQERLALGPSYADSGHVFTSELGKPLHPDLTSKLFDRLVGASGLSRIRFHDLRHTWATLALEAGVPAKIVSQRLGHSSIAITLDIYSHATPLMDREAGEMVARLYRSTI